VDSAASGSDGALARAQRLAGDGDLEGAVAILDTLPGGARGPLEGWRARAQRRIDIDAHVAGLRAQAGADLAAAQGGRP
jgi:hypothetical protein